MTGVAADNGQGRIDRRDIEGFQGCSAPEEVLFAHLDPRLKLIHCQ
jgi:hypothetical protein